MHLLRVAGIAFLSLAFTPAVRGEPPVSVRILERTSEPLLKADRPWEDFCITYCQVLRDGDAWHMWYSSFDHAYKDDRDGMLCYTVSRDGLTWEKPNLGLIEYDGKRDNNILFRRGVHGHCVFIEAAAEPAARFKMVFSNLLDQQWQVFGATSADGVNWTRIEHPLLAHNSDTQNACYRDGDVYRLFVRAWTGGDYTGKRVVGYSESRTFGGFPAPKVILAPDENDPPDLHFYNPAAMKLRDGVHVMFPSAFHTGDDSVRPHLAVSRDGRMFERVGRAEFVPMGKGFDSRAIYVAPGAVPADNPGEYWLYYVGLDVGHDANTPDKTKHAGGVGRIRINAEVRLRNAE